MTAGLPSTELVVGPNRISTTEEQVKPVRVNLETPIGRCKALFNRTSNL